MYSSQQQYVDDTTTRNSDQVKAWPPYTPGAQEAEGDIQQLTPTPENNTQGLGEQMQNSNEVTQRCPQIFVSPTSKYQFSERHGKQCNAHDLQCELAAKLHPKDVEVGVSSDRSLRQDQVNMVRV